MCFTFTKIDYIVHININFNVLALIKFIKKVNKITILEKYNYYSYKIVILLKSI